MERAGKRSLHLIKTRDPTLEFAQMRAYSSMPTGIFSPYAMVSNPTNFSSAEINTDKFGFRLSQFKGTTISLNNIEDFERVNVLIGGSTVFGVGSSGDETTISSYLGQLTGEPWLNLGVRAAVSFQEYIHFIQHFKKIKKIGKVVFFSGINDIYRNYLDSHDASYDKRFQRQNDLYSINSAKRIAYAYGLSLITGRTVDSFLNGYQRLDEDEDGLSEKIGIRNLQSIFDRNFHLYSALSSYNSFSMAYFIQPFFPLTGKVGTAKEMAAIDQTEAMQANTNWLETKARIIDQYPESKSLMFDLAKCHDIPIFDTNSAFGSNESLFVDNVHLTDAGNKIAADLINEKT